MNKNRINNKGNSSMSGIVIATLVILVIIAIVFIIIDAVRSNQNHHHPHPHPRPPYNPKGHDVDKHGCNRSAGYKWCKPKKKCIRPFEEKCK